MNPRTRSTHEAEELFTLKLKPGPGLCCVKGCRKNIGRSDKMGLCHAHYQYRWRMKNKKKSAYATLRDHARGRGIPFTISAEYFQGLMDAVAYWDHQAESRGEWLSIDRIRAWEGYVPGNLRIISHSQNSAKSHRERFLPVHVQSLIDRRRERARRDPALADEQEKDPF